MDQRKAIIAATLAVLLCWCFTAAQAAPKSMILAGQVRTERATKAVPGQLNYQGYLADAADSSAVTATLQMTFRLFDAESGGSELWSETHPAVEVSNGLFQVFLGSLTAFPDGLFDGSALWLQTEVGPGILVPRKPLVSTAYSHRANSAEMLLDYTLTDLDDRWVNEDQTSSVTSDMIADEEIIDDDVSATAEIDPTKIAGTAWTADNDGAGSGLDADLLDGQQAAEFIGMDELDHLDAADGDPADAVYVDDDGKVGIGTTGPLTELDVNGSVNAATYYGDGSHLTGISGTTDGDWTISGNNIYSAVSGNVGIGLTNPVHKLDVSGKVRIGNPVYSFSDAVSLALIAQDNTYTSVPLLVTNPAMDHIFYVRGTGEVGIGTYLPTEKLDVAGVVRMTGFKMPTGASDGYVLTSNATGVGTWQSPATDLWTDQGDWIEASTSPLFEIYDDDPNWWGLCFVEEPQTGAVTNWLNDGSHVSHCYSDPMSPDLYGLWAEANSDSNDIAVYGYGEEWGGYFGCSIGGTAVMGESSDTTRYGMLGTPSFGVLGQHESGNRGYLGGLGEGSYSEAASALIGTIGALGSHLTMVDGTGYYFTNTHCGVVGACYWGMDYHCGVQGATYSIDSGIRTSGVQGIFSDNNSVWGSLAYKTSGSVNYGGYFTSYTSGGGKGSLESDVLSTAGLGAWGDLFGADIHGKVYGTYTEGENYGLYSHGMVVRDDLDVHLQHGEANATAVLYTNVSTDVTVQTSGYCRLSNGVCSVTFDRNFRDVVSSEVPVVVTATPVGSSNGVHLDRVDQNGFTVTENNAGKSDVQVAFIAIGRRAGYEHPQLPAEVVSADYVDKLSRGLHNDADTGTDGQGLYYENGQLSIGQHISMLPHPDKSREPAREAESTLPPRPRRVDFDELGHDNRTR